MKNVKVIGVALASIVATAAFILSCETGPKSATAQQQACSQWEVSSFSLLNSCPNGTAYPETCDLPAGWEVVGDAGGPVLLRHCKK